MAPGTARLQLVAPLGADAMGTYWHAYDLARGVPVQVHELQGAYTEWRPATMPGYELVREGDRAFVILPGAPAPVPAPARKSGGRWVIVGVAGFVVVAVTAVVLAFVLAPAGPSSSAQPPAQPGPVNVSLVEVTEGDCVTLTITDWTDPFQEINAARADCGSATGVRVATGVHKYVPRERVLDNVYLCENPDGKGLAVWSSRNGLFGTLICIGAAQG